MTEAADSNVWVTDNPGRDWVFRARIGKDANGARMGTEEIRSPEQLTLPLAHRFSVPWRFLQAVCLNGS